MIYFKQNAVIDIRLEFAQRYIDKKFVNDKSGGRVLEIICANFIKKSLDKVLKVCYIVFSTQRGRVLADKNCEC